MIKKSKQILGFAAQPQDHGSIILYIQRLKRFCPLKNQHDSKVKIGKKRPISAR
jgi:UDP-N-acetylglucosamine pyrophosphorylase